MASPSGALEPTLQSIHAVIEAVLHCVLSFGVFFYTSHRYDRKNLFVFKPQVSNNTRWDCRVQKYTVCIIMGQVRA